MVRTTAAVLLVLSLAAPAVDAQEPVAPPVTTIRASIEKIRFDPAPDRQTAQQVRFQQKQQVSRSAKVKVGVAGAIVGFIGGGIIGAKLEPSCGCDDPGFKGFSIGAPIGAILTAIALVRFASD